MEAPVRMKSYGSWPNESPAIASSRCAAGIVLDSGEGENLFQLAEEAPLVATM